ncbi:MAG: hypothetical protein P8K78_05640 [Pirellulales bacterium]|nr:hypothetical protein [Pirellulales bacterium]
MGNSCRFHQRNRLFYTEESHQGQLEINGPLSRYHILCTPGHPVHVSSQQQSMPSLFGWQRDKKLPEGRQEE